MFKQKKITHFAILLYATNVLGHQTVDNIEYMIESRKE